MATIKQRLAVKKIVENHGNISKSMVQVGYDKTTAKNPKNLTESKGFQEIWKELIPKDLIINTHRRILNKVDKDGQPHSDAAKGVDMAYKVDGAYAPDKHLNVNVEVEASPEIKELTKKLNEQYEK